MKKERLINYILPAMLALTGCSNLERKLTERNSNTPEAMIAKNGWLGYKKDYTTHGVQVINGTNLTVTTSVRTNQPVLFTLYSERSNQDEGSLQLRILKEDPKDLREIAREEKTTIEYESLKKETNGLERVYSYSFDTAGKIGLPGTYYYEWTSGNPSHVLEGIANVLLFSPILFREKSPIIEGRFSITN